MLELTGVARLLLHLLDHAQEQGLDRDRLVREAGLNQQDLQDPDARVGTTKIESMWHILVSRIPDPALGISIARSVGIRDLGLIGYTMAYSDTLQRALNPRTSLTSLFIKSDEATVSSAS